METSGRDLEFAAMRATIRERGTIRMAIVPLVFIGWAGVAVATAAIITVALSTLVPLMVLAAGFETLFALHVNIERIGRYVQAFHEPAGAGWEHVAMAFARQPATGAPDALFGRLFTLAVSVNFLPAALGGEPWEIAVVGAGHFAFLFRIRKAQGFAARQRADDLARFERLRDTPALARRSGTCRPRRESKPLRRANRSKPLLS